MTHYDYESSSRKRQATDDLVMHSYHNQDSEEEKENGNPNSLYMAFGDLDVAENLLKQVQGGVGGGNHFYEDRDNSMSMGVNESDSENYNPSHKYSNN